MKDVLFLHGYNVTSTKTYGVLAERLKKSGFKVRDIFLSKYVTLDDDLTLTDIIRAFQAALEDVYGDKLADAEFACITHSTGGLVARGWINQYYRHRMSALPMTHLIMLAPPNNGSRLANLGKSKLSRMRWILGVEPGVKVLDDLELGSQFQWDLNLSWINEELHVAKGFFPFVITGQWIDKKIWDVLVPATYERGSDGVVRAASANLNMRYFAIHPDKKPVQRVMEEVAYLITPKTAHSDERHGIMMGIPSKGDHPVFDAILKALNVEDRSSYKAVSDEFSTQTAAIQRDELYYNGTQQQRYSQLLFRVTDQMGNTLNDYAIELIDGEKRGDQFPAGFFLHQHKNEIHPENFMFFLCHDVIAQVAGGKIGFRVHAATGSPLVSYPVFEFLSSSNNINTFLRPNQTTLVDLVLKRQLNKNVFRLTKDLSYQKIDGKPSKDWIN